MEPEEGTAAPVPTDVDNDPEYAGDVEDDDAIREELPPVTAASDIPADGNDQDVSDK